MSKLPLAIEWRCHQGHPTRAQQEGDLLLPCGCVFDPNDLTSLAVAIYSGCDIPSAIDHWRAVRAKHGREDQP
jgi:hypothetical protein